MQEKQFPQKLSQEEATEVFMKHIDFVRAVAFKNAPARHLQEDITHDAYIHFIEHRTEWEYDPVRIKGLLKVITENMAHQQWRAWTRNLPENLARVACCLQRNPEKVFPEVSNNEEKLTALRLCMQKLSPEDRELVESFYFAKESGTDLAQRLHKTLAAVYKKLSRLRTRLLNCVMKALGIDANPSGKDLADE
ncbi:MAG: sigma-70 family RNA polymerase sigma factor [Planctomycetia bacterium]|nr:sigma-70 family RNA polymerase sigma factor [Planctomycetia bacterium]